MLFGTNKEKLEEVPVWEILPTLPPLLWTKDVFKVIGGELREFLEVDMSLLATRAKRVAKILVRLDP